jgi:CheY-like chemotaxis protein
MKARLVVLGLAASAMLLTPIIADACGDKYLVGGRNCRYDRAANPSNILIYRGASNDAITAALTDPKLQRKLQKAGHTVVICESIDQCVEALEGEEGYDIILTDFAQAQKLDAILGKGTDTTLVPVFYKASKETLKEAKEEGYKVVINAKNKNLDRDINRAIMN